MLFYYIPASSEPSYKPDHVPLFSIQKSAPWSIRWDKEKEGMWPDWRWWGAGEGWGLRTRHSFLPASPSLPRASLFFTSRCRVFRVRLVTWPLSIEISTGSHCSNPCQSDLLGLLRHLQAWGGPDVLHKEWLKRWESGFSTLLLVYQHSLAPSFTPAVIWDAELFVWPKQYLDSRQELFYPQSFLWICTTFVRQLWVEQKAPLPPSFLWGFSPKSWGGGLVVQMAEWCHLWTKATQHQWFPR